MVILPRWFYIKTIINQTFNDIFFAIERLCETLDIKITKRLQPLDLDKKYFWQFKQVCVYFFIYKSVMCMYTFSSKGLFGTKFELQEQNKNWLK